MRVRANGIDVEVEADEGSGEPLVLIMGIGAQLCFWPDTLLDGLRSFGFRIIRFDNRDAGLSTHMRHMPVPNPRVTLMRAAIGLPIEAPYDLGDMADDLAGVLDSLQISRAHIAGASMGGMIAQTFAIRHSTRVRSLTSIMSTPGDRRYSFGVQPRALRALLGPVPRTREENGERLIAMFRAIGGRTHPVDETRLREMGWQAFDRGVNPAGFARQMAAIWKSGSRSEQLKKLNVPTLVIHGTQDPLIPAAAGRATARLIPNAWLLELGDMGHDLPAPLHATIAGAIASLARRAGAAI